MTVHIVTLFPRIFEGVLTESMLGRAARSGRVTVSFVNPRDFATGRRRRVDDRPYGGGPGMVLMAEPVYRAVRSVRRKTSRVVLMSPQGRRFDAAVAERLAKRRHLVFVCGRYEGLDERLRSVFDEELSIGDYVLTGGELPAMVVLDGVVRLLPGVLAKEGAAAQESFGAASEGALDYPHYTRPRVWRGRRVPAALLSGDHATIALWRRRAARDATRRKRPDLLNGMDS